MTRLQEHRKKTGMSQFLLAQSSGVPRMRLSLAETGQICLTKEEEAAVRRALEDFISRKARELTLLAEESMAGSEVAGVPA